MIYYCNNCILVNLLRIENHIVQLYAFLYATSFHFSGNGEEGGVLNVLATEESIQIAMCTELDRWNIWLILQ